MLNLLTSPTTNVPPNVIIPLASSMLAVTEPVVAKNVSSLTAVKFAIDRIPFFVCD